jgi:hypothetical protein
MTGPSESFWIIWSDTAWLIDKRRKQQNDVHEKSQNTRKSIPETEQDRECQAAIIKKSNKRTSSILTQN